MAPPVSPALSLPVTLHGLRVGLSILPGIIRMTGAPFLLAVAADLAVHEIGLDLATVIIPPLVPLTVCAPTNGLVRMKAGRLKELLAVAAGAIAHRGAPDRKVSRSIVADQVSAICDLMGRREDMGYYEPFTCRVEVRHAFEPETRRDDATQKA